MSSKAFNLPLHQQACYWISLYPGLDGFAPTVAEALLKAGCSRLDDQGMAVKAPQAWKPVWDTLYATLGKLNALGDIGVAVTPGETLPAGKPDLKPAAAIQAIADNLWIGDALLEGRVMCYLQPVMSAPDKIFGYESFARARATDGSIVAGNKIVAASKVLGIEHMIDRHLQVQAIRTFVSSAFNGFLFVNFFPGFIHRPAVYLEGLSEAAKGFGIIAKHIVLDFTRAETPHDIAHLKSVCDYGRSRGYSVALDDIESVDGARRLIGDIRPDFVKIDMNMVKRVAEPQIRDAIRQIVELTHASGGAAIGEGIENEESYQALRQLGVDLFQGYYFSPPVPVEAVERGDVAMR